MLFVVSRLGGVVILNLRFASVVNGENGGGGGGGGVRNGNEGMAHCGKAFKNGLIFDKFKNKCWHGGYRGFWIFFRNLTFGGLVDFCGFDRNEIFF